MWQLLILIAVVSTVYLISRSKSKLKKKLDAPANQMVRCQSCNLNLPISEAFKSENGWFCSEDRKCQNL